MTNRFAHALPFGATLVDPGHTRFRIWAPSQPRLDLEIDGCPPQPMQRCAKGWYELIVECGAGERYRYRLADGLAVPDPAARAQVDDVHGDSLVVDPRAYVWQCPHWRGRPWHETVLYELHVGACGGFRGVIEQLPALADLGVTAIELMPLNDFPRSRNWGYDGVLPYAPDASYGTPEELKQLVDAAHALGLMIFIDVVYNHFGPDGNYLHAYAADFFTEDRHTPWGAAIDFKRAPVREFFIHNALYWLEEYRFDGLRLDAVHAIDDQSFLSELAQRVRTSVAPERQVHLVLENENNDASLLRSYDAQWNDDAHNALHVLLTGEHEGYYASYAQNPAEKLARVLAEGFAYQGEPMPSRNELPRGSASAHLPATAFVFFLQNHDQIGNRAFGKRLIDLCDSRALRAASLLQMLCPQIPLLFMGEEWGCRTPFLFFTDHSAELAPKVAMGRRQEFAGFAAFADPAARARIPDPNDPLSFHHSVPDRNEANCREHADWLAWYRQLLALRHTHIIPALPGTRNRDAHAVATHGVFAQWQLGNGVQLTIVANLGDNMVPLAAALSGRLLLETEPGVGDAARRGQLAGYSACATIGHPQ